MCKHVISFYFYLYYNLLGKNIKIGRNVVIDKNSQIIGNNLINDNVRINNIYIDEYSYISPFSIIINTNIGRYCSIGPGVKIGLGVHPIDLISTSPYIYNDTLFKEKRSEDFKLSIIGNDVWIGANVLIMGGVTIGNGAIIGAGAVITKDVPAYAVVVGVPGKIIKYRFEEDKINYLNNSEWWSNSPDIVRGIYEK
ncbi:antibiotic acetyltransferase [Aliivibrio fischeri]|nr:antibiotic acetyltransferase [Aliivibrio fischeri]MUI63802.1 antibiotic acetyltransferase [Aliivibrio fischeri]